MTDSVWSWLLGRVDSPHLLTGLCYIAKHSINGECKVLNLSEPQPMELSTGGYLSLIFLNQMKFCIFCETQNSDRNSETLEDTEDTRKLQAEKFSCIWDFSEPREFENWCTDD